MIMKKTYCTVLAQAIVITFIYIYTLFSNEAAIVNTHKNTITFAEGVMFLHWFVG